MEYIRTFKDTSTFATVKSKLLKPNLCVVKAIGTAKPEVVQAVGTNSEPEVDYSMPFYIENVDSVDATISIVGPNQDFEISSDKTTWVNYTKETEVTIPSGNKLYIKTLQDTGTFKGYGLIPTRISSPLTIKCKCAIGGNIMSLAYQNFENIREITISSAFQYAFSRANMIVDASKLVLPATTLAESCYYQMFLGCTGLTTAPKLPATKLADICYQQMFASCTSLTTAPELPATTLAEGCYNNMFYNCKSLTTAPELPATTLAEGCYNSMFSHCTSLTTAPSLPVETLVEKCYYQMFVGCTSLTTAPELPATTLAEGCYGGMFQSCTSLTTAPSLPVETLVEKCYYQMFVGCTSLTTAPELPATTLAEDCYYGMFEGCTSLTTAPELPATELANYCYYGMFWDCTGLTTAPELPATTLVESCYSCMFQGCSNLNYIKAMFTTEPSATYTEEWVDEVASTGTFVKNAAATWDVTGINGIPDGWTVETVVCTNANGYDYVDLGLPSGTLWATCNVGANSPEEYGKYFAWGEIEGYYDNEEHDFSWSNYKYSDEYGSEFSKYNTSDEYGVVDNKRVLELEDDAVHVNMGGDWKMPTATQMNELLNETNHEWVENYHGTGINGGVFTSKSDSSKSIFIPASGYRQGSDISLQSLGTYLWTSKLHSLLMEYGISGSINILPNSFITSNNSERCDGYCIRGVITPAE